MCLFICNCTHSSTSLFGVHRSLETRVPPVPRLGKLQTKHCKEPEKRDLNQGLLGIFFLDLYEVPLSFVHLLAFWSTKGARHYGTVLVLRNLLWTVADHLSSQGTSKSPCLTAPFCSAFRSPHTESCTSCHIPVFPRQPEALWLHPTTSLMWLC